MSFSRAPLSRFNEKNAQKTASRVVTPQLKDQTKPSSCAPRSPSKYSLSRQRSVSSTQYHPIQQQQIIQQQQQLQQLRGRIALGSQSSTMSLEVNENTRTTSHIPSRSKSRDVAERSRAAVRSRTGPAQAAGAGAEAGADEGASSEAGSASTRAGQAMAKRRVMESQFAYKSKRFAALRKEVVEKQRVLADLHGHLLDIHERLQAVGAKDTAPPEPLPWVEAGDAHGGGGGGGGGGVQASRRRRSSTASPPPAGEGGSLVGGDAASHNGLPACAEETLRRVEAQLRALPGACLEMCRDTLNKRNEVLTWFLELDSSRALLDDEMRAKLELYRREGDATDTEMATTQGAQQGEVEAALKAVRTLVARMCLRAQAARAPGEAEAVAGAAATIERLEAERAQAEERSHQLEQQLQALVQELHAAERRACAATDEAVSEHERFRLVTDQLGLMDGYLKEERQRMRELEARLTADEGRIQKVNSQMSSVEEQLHARQAQHEQRMQALAEEARARQEAHLQLEAQKEALERRVQDLGALLAGRDGGDTNVLSQMNALKEEMQKELEKEKELRIKVHTDLERERSRTKELEEKIQQLNDALLTAANPEDGDAEGSALAHELAQELDAMKQQLCEALRQVAALEKERVAQEEAVKKLEERQARDQEERERLAAELAQREEQVREVRARAEAQRERVAAAERQLASASRAARPLEKVLQQQQHDFQKKVCELQNALKEVVRHNDELERSVAQKQQEVEQRERVMREQAKVLKVRDELIVLLKSKEQCKEEALTALRDAASDKEDKHLQSSVAAQLTKEVAAKNEEIRRLTDAIEERKKQTAQLETLVQQLQEQQERSQAQRTRQEARISSLEMLLQAHDTGAAHPGSAPASSGGHAAPGHAAAAPPGSAPAPRYAPRAPPPPPPPLHPQPQPLYFFWDGKALRQEQRIPSGAAAAPAKGTFYLTVTPKPRDASAPSNPNNASTQFYVTANIGAHDVEEGRDGEAEEISKEALAQAARAAMTCAAYAAVASSYPQAVTPTRDFPDHTNQPPTPHQTNAPPAGGKQASTDYGIERESDAFAQCPTPSRALSPHTSRSVLEMNSGPQLYQCQPPIRQPPPAEKPLQETPEFQEDSCPRVGSIRRDMQRHSLYNAQPQPEESANSHSNAVDVCDPDGTQRCLWGTVESIPAPASGTLPGSSDNFSVKQRKLAAELPKAPSADSEAFDSTVESSINRWFQLRGEKEPKANQRIDPMTDYGPDRIFPTFLRTENIVSATECANEREGKPASWFAVRSRTDPNDRFSNGHSRIAHSFVTLPGITFDETDTSSQPHDVIQGDDFSTCSTPAVIPPTKSETATGTVGSSWSDKGARIQWGLPTIDEVNSESREHSESTSQVEQDTDADVDDDPSSIGSRGLSDITVAPCGLNARDEDRSSSCSTRAAAEDAKATEGATSATDSDQPQELCSDSPVLDYWQAQHNESCDWSSEVSTDVSFTPHSNDDAFPRSTSTLSRKMASNIKEVPDPVREDGLGCPAHGQAATPDPARIKAFPRRMRKATQPRECSICDSLTSQVSIEREREMYVVEPNSPVRKCFTMFTSCSTNPGNRHINLQPEIFTQRSKQSDTNAYHKAFRSTDDLVCEINKRDHISKNGDYQNTVNVAKFKHASDTSVFSPTERRSGVRMSATLFDIQRRLEESEGNTQSPSHGIRPNSSPYPIRNNAITNRHSMALHQLRDLSPDSTNPLDVFTQDQESSLPISCHLGNCCNECEQPEYYVSENTAAECKTPQSRILTSNSRIQLSKYKPIRHILSKSCIAPVLTEKSSVPKQAVVSPFHKLEHSWTNITQQKQGNIKCWEHSNKSRHRHWSVPRCASVDRYPLSQTNCQESFEETDSASETSYQTNQNNCEGNDLYEGNTLFTYESPVYLSTQYLDTCDCHGKRCKHILW